MAHSAKQLGASWVRPGPPAGGIGGGRPVSGSKTVGSRQRAESRTAACAWCKLQMCPAYWEVLGGPGTQGKEMIQALGYCRPSRCRVHGIATTNAWRHGIPYLHKDLMWVQRQLDCVTSLRLPYRYRVARRGPIPLFPHVLVSTHGRYVRGRPGHVSPGPKSSAESTSRPRSPTPRLPTHPDILVSGALYRYNTRTLGPTWCRTPHHLLRSGPP